MCPTEASVAEFLDRVPERRREDARRLCAMMQEITGKPPAMWGTSIIGFGSYHYRYPSGGEGDSALASFAPRSQTVSPPATSRLTALTAARPSNSLVTLDKCMAARWVVVTGAPGRRDVRSRRSPGFYYAL